MDNCNFEGRGDGRGLGTRSSRSELSTWGLALRRAGLRNAGHAHGREPICVDGLLGGAIAQPAGPGGGPRLPA